MSDVVLVYTTHPSKEEAERVASELLNHKLIACANIFSGVTSMYSWEGKNQKEEECIAFFKTGKDKLQLLQDLYENLHSYDCPCFVVLPSEHVNPDYERWLLAQVKRDSIR